MIALSRFNLNLEQYCKWRIGMRKRQKMQQSKWHKRYNNFYPMVRSSVICLPTPRCGVSMDEGCTQLLSSDPKIKLEYHGPSLYLTISQLWGISTSWSLWRLTKMITIENRSKGGSCNTQIVRVIECTRNEKYKRFIWPLVLLFSFLHISNHGINPDYQ